MPGSPVESEMRPGFRDFVRSEVPQLTEIEVTMGEEVGTAPGSYVGASPAERDPTPLRARRFGANNFLRDLREIFFYYLCIT
mmetsp:Transcript_19033/g.43342  ORF Transcript_19033/g.43342 Transcript_19033/m.43342 type:complete len:82 (+) Transcript_19033:775-1020(+)